MKPHISFSIPVRAIITASLFVFSASLQAQAQSVTIFGGNFAQNCYENATFSVRLSDASSSDLADCNQAIQQGRLNRRDLVATYINRGIINVHVGDIGRAERDYLTALDMSDRTPETFLNLGNLQYMMTNYHRAIADYDHAESLGFRQSHILHINRGMALYRLGSLDEAEAEILKALEIRPDWSRALDQLKRIDNRRLELAQEAAAAERQ